MCKSDNYTKKTHFGQFQALLPRQIIPLWQHQILPAPSTWPSFDSAALGMSAILSIAASTEKIVVGCVGFRRHSSIVFYRTVLSMRLGKNNLFYQRQLCNCKIIHRIRKCLSSFAEIHKQRLVMGTMQELSPMSSEEVFHPLQKVPRFLFCCDFFTCLRIV